jgi:hypothetical protein
MDDIDELERQNALVHELDDESPQNPMEALRARRQEVAERREVLIPIIGYEDLNLKAKYRLLDRSETTAIAERVRKSMKGKVKSQSDFMFYVLMDTIIAACEGLFLGDTLETAKPLMSEDGEHEVNTYAEFATNLNNGDPLPSHRAAVRYVFGENDFAVGQHGLLLNRWLGNTNIDIDEEALGE